MQNFLEKLKNAGKSVAMRSEAKKALRERLVHFMDATDAVRERDHLRHTMQRSFLTNPIQYFKTMPIAVIIAILALVGGGTSFAAEAALPGNILFPLKVHVNEEVRSAFTFGSEAKADFAVDRAERRLTEAATLAAQGKLSTEAKAQAEDNFKAQADDAQARIVALKANGDVRGAANVESHFEGALNAQVKILNALRGEKKESEKDVEPIEAHANRILRTVVDFRGELESDIESTSTATSTSEGNAEAGVDAKAAAQGKLDAAANVLSSTRAFVENKKDLLNATTTLEIEAKLQADADVIAQGQAKLQAGLFGEAFNLGNRAIRDAREIRATVDANLKLNLHIRLDNEREDEDNVSDRHGRDIELDENNSVNVSSSATSSLEIRNRGRDNDNEGIRGDSNEKTRGELKVNLGL